MRASRQGLVSAAWLALASVVGVGGLTPHALALEPASIVPSRALELFHAAEAEIALGESWSGQRLLELLVARYPDSAEAQAARRLLAMIYTSAGSDDVPDARATHPTPTETAVPPASRPASARESLIADVGDRVFFPDGSAGLGARAKQVIAAQAQWLGRYPAMRVVVEGHADDRGFGVDPEMIALARAQAVRDQLIAEGISADRITVRSKGNAQRVALCDDAPCGAQNRRAVVQVVELPSQSDGDVRSAATGSAAR
jgi:peptidoglycan-associated lipoprotein